jgi:hypothetical protein
LLVRASFLIATALVCALGASSDHPVAGRWTAHAPDPIGRTEALELRFAVANSALTGVLRTEDGDIPVKNVHFQGRVLTFDAIRDWRGHREIYHYDGKLSGDTLDFTVQNDDGSSFFRFLAHRVP